MDPLTVLFGLVLWFWKPKKKKKSKRADVKIPDDKKDDKKADVLDIPDDSEYIAKVDALISKTAKEKHFFQITSGGPNASQMAAAVLQARGANTGPNRLRLIKCMTMIPYNRKRYTAEHPATSWGLAYNVGNKNLSAAWLPRHAPAAQLLAEKKSPPRTISISGSGNGGYYAVLWIPKIILVGGQLVCNPDAEGPPQWLMNAIGGS